MTQLGALVTDGLDRLMLSKGRNFKAVASAYYTFRHHGRTGERTRCRGAEAQAQARVLAIRKEEARVPEVRQAEARISQVGVVDSFRRIGEDATSRILL